MESRKTPNNRKTTSFQPPPWWPRALFILAVLCSLAALLTLWPLNSFWWPILMALSLSAVYLVLVPGTSSNIDTPAAAPPDPLPETDSSHSSAQTADADTPVEQSSDQIPERVLLISRDSSDRHAIRRHITGWGSELELCENSARAFAMLINAVGAGRPFQTVIIDQYRLDFDPKQFAILLKAEQELQETFLIHVGSVLPNNLAKQLLAAGFSKLLTAPLDKTLLFNALRNQAVDQGDGSQVVQLLDRYAANRKIQPLDILVAESDITEQTRLRNLLQDADHHVFIVSNGAQALDALDSHHFDLAICQAVMPEVTGLEALKLYRFTRLDHPWIPFILLVDTPDTQLIKACEEADVEAILSKPVERKLLLSTINRITQKSGLETSVQEGTASQDNPEVCDQGLTLDRRKLDELNKLGKDREFLRKLIDQFEKDIHLLLDNMHAAIQDNRPRRLRDLGHTLMDSAGSIGALSLYRLGLRASRMRSEEIDDEADQLLTEIRDSSHLTLKSLHNYLSAGNNSAFEYE